MLKSPFRREKTITPVLETPETDTAEPVDEAQEARMSLFEHLNELRVRVFRALFAIVLGTLIGFAFAGNVLDFLREPYCQAVEQGDSCRLLIIDPTGGIIVYFRVSLMVGGILAIPIITYQIMMFVLPGLTTKEKRFVLLSMPPVFLLFLIGVVFTWFVLMPAAINFLETFQPERFKTDWTADLYLSFVTSLIFWMGVAFETPLIFFVLSVLGFVTAGSMARNWRVAVVGAAIAAALITPTIDPLNMALVMGPLLALYLLSIFLVSIGSRLNRPVDDTVPASS
jgi:sec-independent protein translocase protein TatC